MLYYTIRCDRKSQHICYELLENKTGLPKNADFQVPFQVPLSNISFHLKILAIYDLTFYRKLHMRGLNNLPMQSKLTTVSVYVKPLFGQHSIIKHQRLLLVLFYKGLRFAKTFMQQEPIPLKFSPVTYQLSLFWRSKIENGTLFSHHDRFYMGNGQENDAVLSVFNSVRPWSKMRLY